MKLVRSIESWRIVSVCPVVPNRTSWWATRPRRWDPVHPDPHRRPLPRGPPRAARGGSGPRPTQLRPQPFVPPSPSWSPTVRRSWRRGAARRSQRSRTRGGAASSAKRISSTAPIAGSQRPDSWSRGTGTATPRCRRPRSRSCRPPCGPRGPRAHARFVTAASRCEKSTATVAPLAATRATSRSTVRSLSMPTIGPRRSPARPGSTVATSSRSSSPSTARQTSDPIRPVAPSTATLIVMTAILRVTHRRTGPVGDGRGTPARAPRRTPGSLRAGCR